MPRAITIADPVDQFVGQRVRAERMHRKLTQTQLGAALGVSFQQVQKYERGTNRMSASMLVKAARALDIAVAELLPPAGGEPDSTRTDILSIRGGEALVEHFSAMRPSQRLVLLQVAQEFARATE